MATREQEFVDLRIEESPQECIDEPEEGATHQIHQRVDTKVEAGEGHVQAVKRCPVEGCSKKLAKLGSKKGKWTEGNKLARGTRRDQRERNIAIGRRESVKEEPERFQSSAALNAIYIEAPQAFQACELGKPYSLA